MKRREFLRAAASAPLAVVAGSVAAAALAPRQFETTFFEYRVRGDSSGCIEYQLVSLPGEPIAVGTETVRGPLKITVGGSNA